MKIKTKNYVALSLTYAIILAVIVVSFLLIPFPKHTVSWIAFGFGILAFLASAGTTILATIDSNRYRGILYGYPIFKIGIIYAVTQLFLTILVCTLASLFNIPAWTCILIGILAFSVFLIFTIFAQTARNNITNIEEQGELTTKNTVTFNIEAGGLLDLCEDSNLRNVVARLLEEFKYSDPVSSAETLSLEEKINQSLQELRELITAHNVELAETKTKEIFALLAERNRICKAKKQSNMR